MIDAAFRLFALLSMMASIWFAGRAFRQLWLGDRIAMSASGQSAVLFFCIAFLFFLMVRSDG